MDISINCLRLWDVSVVHHIFHSEEMWEAITEDGSVDTLPDVIKDVYLGLYSGDGLLGCFKLVQETSVCWCVHTCILKQHRKVAVQCGLAAMRWVLENTPNIEKIISHIPQTQKHVIHYALRIGMIEEGINRRSFVKNNSVVDQILVGMTREEMILKLKEK